MEELKSHNAGFRSQKSERGEHGLARTSTNKHGRRLSDTEAMQRGCVEGEEVQLRAVRRFDSAMHVSLPC